MAIGNMHQKFCKDCVCGSGDILVGRQTNRQTDTLITILCNCCRWRSIKFLHFVVCRILVCMFLDLAVCHCSFTQDSIAQNKALIGGAKVRSNMMILSLPYCMFIFPLVFAFCY